jgi:hypothetical protein
MHGIEKRFKPLDDMNAKIEAHKGQRNQLYQQYQQLKETNPQAAQQMVGQIRQMDNQTVNMRNQAARYGGQMFSGQERADFASAAFGMQRAQGQTPRTPEEEKALASGDVGAYSRAKDKTERGLNVNMDDMGPKPEFNRELAKTNPAEYKRQQQAVNQWNKTYQERKQTALQTPNAQGQLPGPATPGAANWQQQTPPPANRAGAPAPGAPAAPGAPGAPVAPAPGAPVAPAPGAAAPGVPAGRAGRPPRMQLRLPNMPGAPAPVGNNAQVNKPVVKTPVIKPMGGRGGGNQLAKAKPPAPAAGAGAPAAAPADAAGENV